MTIYIDENIPHHLAESLDILQSHENLRLLELNMDTIEVKSIIKEFERGIKDEEWIPKAGAQGACVITRDKNIQNLRHQRELYQKHSLGLFFLHAESKKHGLSFWDMVESIIKHWPEIAKHALKEERPFAFRFHKLGKQLEEM